MYENYDKKSRTTYMIMWEKKNLIVSGCSLKMLQVLLGQNLRLTLYMRIQMSCKRTPIR